jgi:hypothetical protein
LGLFNRFNVGFALLQPKINPNLVVRSLTAPASGNAASIKRIVRQYGMNGKQYYYVILVNTFDNFYGQNPTARELQEQQRYQGQVGVNIYFPELGIVRSCEELITTDTDVAAVPVELETVTLAGFGTSQRIRGGVEFGAAGVKIYRLEINQPAVTPVTLVANIDAKGGANLTNAAQAHKNNETVIELLPDYWLALAPNPASDITTVQCTLPRNEALTLTVRDMLGRIVLQPFVQEPYSQGAHDIPLTTASLPSGVYTVTISTNARSQSIPLHILR